MKDISRIEELRKGILFIHDTCELYVQTGDKVFLSHIKFLGQKAQGLIYEDDRRAMDCTISLAPSLWRDKAERAVDEAWEKAK